jgi:hypothetical protein
MDEDPRNAVLEVVWEHVVGLFFQKGFRHPARATLEFDAGAHDSCRHFAACEVDGSRVLVAPALADMPHSTVVGILAHEAGHVEDLSSPGIWWFRTGRLLRVDSLPSKGTGKILRSWAERTPDEIERVADALGEVAIGERIGYVGHDTCLVQCVGTGRRRPKNLS